MIANLNPYPNMRSSGVPWVGDFPNHWRMTPNRAMLSRRKVLVGKAFNEYTLLSLTKEGVIVRDISTARGKFSADMGTCQEVRRGDLVFCLFDVPETPRTVGLSPHDGMITGAYTVFECDDPVLARFVEAFYIAMDDRKLLRPLYSGLRNTITPLRFLGTKTPVPTHVEQHAIVRFLDHADRRIRRYIRSKERLIELLEEQKQAIIHQAVTGQIDVRTGQPYPAYKESGVEWLGNVPAHWQWVSNKAMLSRRKVLVGKRYTEYQLLSLTKTGVIVRDVSSGRGKFSADMGTSQQVRCGDLVFCLFDVPETPRTVGLSEHNGMITSAYTVLGCNDRMLGRFLEAFYIAMDDRKLLSPLYSGLRNTIPPSKFLGIKTPVPPRNEQRLILGHIGELAAKIRRDIAYAKKEVRLLEEYCTRLIADVVTGKLDVREPVASLADVETLDESLRRNPEAIPKEPDPVLP